MEEKMTFQEVQIVYLQSHDLYCVMIKDAITGKYFKAEDYEEWLKIR